MSCIAVILAGGLGMRLRNTVPNTPKVLAKVNGKPFLYWLIKYLKINGINDIAISTGYMADQVSDYIKTITELDINIQCIEEKKQLGTGGGVLNVVKNINVKFNKILVLNGDSISFHNIQNFIIDDHIKILVKKVDNNLRYGSVEFDHDNLLKNFIEKNNDSRHVFINTGIYLFPIKSLNFPFAKNKILSFEYDIFPYLLSKKVKIYVEITKSDFIDIGTEDSYLESHNFIKRNINHFESK